MRVSNTIAPFGSFSALLPYGVPWAPGTHRLRNKTFCAMFEVEGFDALVSSKHEMWQRANRIRESIDRLGPQWFFEAHVIRSRYAEHPRAKGVRNRTLLLLDDEHRRLFNENGKFYRNRMFIGIARRHDNAVARYLQQLFGVTRISDEQRGDEAVLEAFEAGVTDFAGALKGAYKRVARLGWDVKHDDLGAPYIVDYQSGMFDECITGETGPLAFMVSHPPLVNGVIGGRDFISGDFPQIDPEGRAIKHAVVSIEGFPAWSIAGVADFLAQQAVENRWFTRYRPMAQSAALWRLGRSRLAAVNRSGKKLEESNPLALTAAQALSQAYSEASELGWLFGHYSGGVVFRDTDETRLRECADAFVDMLRDRHFKARRESRVAWRALLGSYPFNEDLDTRASFISGTDAVNWFPLSQQWTGHEIHPNPKYRELDPETPPERVVVSVGRTPVNLSPFEGDVGHFALVGPSGTGKSTGLKAMVVAKAKNRRQLTVQIDSNYNAYILNRALGGIHIDISGENNKPMICPLARIGDGMVYRDRAQAWFEDTAALLLGSPLRPDEVAELRRGIDLFAGDRSKSLTKFRLAVSSERGMGERLWQVIDELGIDRDGNGLLAAGQSLLPSRDQFHVGGSQLITIEVGSLAGSPRRIMPILMSLFDWMEWLANGDPLTIIADETHKFFKEGRFAARFERFGRELRKMNGHLGLASQYYADFAQGDLGEMLGKAIKNWFLLPNKDAMTEPFADLFASETERLLLMQLMPKEDVLFKNSDGVVPFKWMLGPVEQALICRETPADIAAYREIEAEMVAKNRAAGVDPSSPEFKDFTVPLWLEHCGVPDAQELGRRWVAGDAAWPSMVDGLRPRVTPVAA